MNSAYKACSVKAPDIDGRCIYWQKYAPNGMLGDKQLLQIKPYT